MTGMFLHDLSKIFPGWAFTHGMNTERKFCVFAHRFVEQGTNIPSGNPVFEVETGHGHGEFDKETIIAKLALVCG